MKKLLSVVLTLTLLLACLAVPACAEGTDLSGTWYLNSIGQGDSFFDPTVVGMAITMILNADGTGEMTVVQGEEPESAAVTWSAAEGGIEVVQDGEAQLFTVTEDGMLSASTGDMTLVFGREEPAGEAIPVVVEAASEAEFEGSWKLSRLNMDGTILSTEMIEMFGLSMDVTLAIAEGNVTLAMSVMGTEVPAVTGPATFENGALSLTLEGLAPITIQMTDTGELFSELTVESLETSLPMYFAKAEAAE